MHPGSGRARTGLDDGGRRRKISPMTETGMNNLTPAKAKAEMGLLSARIRAANTAYHTHDAPEISDADYDKLKQRNLAIEARFPDLKRPDSPSDQVGAAVKNIH